MDAGRASAATVTPAMTSVRSRAPEYVDIERAKGTYRVVIGGRLAEAKRRDLVGLAERLHGYTQPGRTTSGIARWG